MLYATQILQEKVIHKEKVFLQMNKMPRHRRLSEYTIIPHCGVLYSHIKKKRKSL